MSGVDAALDSLGKRERWVSPAGLLGTKMALGGSSDTSWDHLRAPFPSNNSQMLYGGRAGGKGGWDVSCAEIACEVQPAGMDVQKRLRRR